MYICIMLGKGKKVVSNSNSTQNLDYHIIKTNSIRVDQSITKRRVDDCRKRRKEIVRLVN